MTKPSRGDRGFTLIEVLVAMLILTTIMGALAAAIIASFSATAASFTRLNASHDRQLVAVYLPRDLLSANSATVRSATQIEQQSGGFTPDCTNAPSGLSITDTTVLQLTWQGLPPVETSTTQSNQYFAVDYAVVPAGSGASVGYRLERFYCDSSTQTGPWTEQTPDTIVAYGLATPTTSSYPAYVQCLASGSLTSCSVPPSPPLVMTVTDISNKVYEISGEMRSST